MANFPVKNVPVPEPLVIREGKAKLIPTAPQEGEGKVSAPGRYRGYSAPYYDGLERHSVYVPVRDGTRLALDYYIPTKDGAAETRPLPVVWELTPYSRCGKSEDGEPALVKRADMASAFLSYGYVVAYADVRGVGSSYGIRDANNSPNDMPDGCDLVEWMAAQPWCDGNIGMFGRSATGQTILATMAGHPEHLRCAVIGVTDYSKYDTWARGGIIRGSGNPDRSREPDYRAPLETSVPVDADTDGSMLREAVEQHRFNGPQSTLMFNLPYRDSYNLSVDGEYWNLVSPNMRKDLLNSSGVAVYLVGGLFDVFRRDTFLAYRNLTLPKKMIIGPWYHGEQHELDMITEHIRFYDYWLKGIQNGIMDEKPICLKTQFAPEGKDWRMIDDWPLPGVTRRSMFLREGKSGTARSVNDGVLGGEASTHELGWDDYTAVYDIKTGVEDSSAAELEEKGLTYTSEPLTEDMELTGHPLASLWAAADREDADFFVVLADIAPDGDSYIVTDGCLRASKRKTANPPAHLDFMGLPWRPSNEADNMPLVPGRAHRLLIEMMPVSYVFKKGHRLRVCVTNALRGFYCRKDAEPAQIKLYRCAAYSSYVYLPVADKQEN